MMRGSLFFVLDITFWRRHYRVKVAGVGGRRSGERAAVFNVIEYRYFVF